MRGLVCFATLGGVLVAAGCSARGPAAPPSRAPTVQAQPASAAVRAVADSLAALLIRHEPHIAAGPFASLPGAILDRLPDRRPAAIAAYNVTIDRMRAELGTVRETDLVGQPEWALYHNLRERLESVAELRVCRTELWDVSHLYGPLFLVRETPRWLPVGSDTARARALRLLSDVPRFLEVEIANLEAGVDLGYVAPRPLVERVIALGGMTLAEAAEASPLYDAALRDSTPGFMTAVDQLVQGPVHAAITRYRDYLRDEYLPRGRATAGLHGIPNGEACYRAHIRARTTLAIGPEEVRARLAALEREEQARLTELVQSRFGRTDVVAFLQESLGAPGAAIPHPDSALALARLTMARAVALTPRAFSRVPTRLPVVVRMSTTDEANGWANRFESSDSSGGTPPRFVLNGRTSTSRLALESTTLHEGWPGHALQMELMLETLRAGGREHPISLWLRNAAYTEGWAVYAEADLGPELGLFSSDTAAAVGMGRRAQQLSVLGLETRIHENALTREEFVPLVLRALGVPLPTAEAAVDRVTATPAQIFAYEIGRAEILRLRREAEAALGPRFDLRQFHDVILQDGPLPLPVLRRKVEQWLEGLAGADQAARGTTADTAGIVAATRAWWRAFTLGDTARLPDLTDATLSLTLSTGETLDRASMLRHAQNRGDSSQVRITWGDEAVTVAENAAVVTSRFEETALGIHGAFRFTSVLRRGGDGAWRMTAAHSTRIRPAPVAVHVPAAELQAFAGRYRLPDGGVLEFVVRDGSLAIRLPDGREDLLVPVTQAVFELPGRARLAFARDARGRVTGLAFIAARGVDQWTRLP